MYNLFIGRYQSPHVGHQEIFSTYLASVNYGRGVGYEVNEIKVSQSTSSISATDIREQIRKGEKKWMMNVDYRIWEDLKDLFTNEQSEQG